MPDCEQKTHKTPSQLKSSQDDDWLRAWLRESRLASSLVPGLSGWLWFAAVRVTASVVSLGASAED